MKDKVNSEFTAKNVSPDLCRITTNETIVTLNSRHAEINQNSNVPKSTTKINQNNANWKKEISIFHQNTRGLKTKTKEFYINLLSEDYDLVSITESWLSPDIGTNELFDPRYVVFRQDRDVEKTGKKEVVDLF